MQIITVDNEQFAELLEVVSQGKLIGSYSCSKGHTTVHITNQYLVVSPENHPNKIAFKPVKNLEDAEYLALQLLRKEELRGSEISLIKEEV